MFLKKSLKALTLILVLFITGCNQNLSSYCANQKNSGGFNSYQGYITIDTETSVRALDFTASITKDKNSNKFKLQLQGSKGPNALNIDIKQDLIVLSHLQIDLKTDFDPNLTKETSCNFIYSSSKVSGKDKEEIRDNSSILKIKEFNYKNEHDYKISGTFSGKDEVSGKAFFGQFESGTNQLATACLY